MEGSLWQAMSAAMSGDEGAGTKRGGGCPANTSCIQTRMILGLKNPAALSSVTPKQIPRQSSKVEREGKVAPGSALTS